MNAIKITKRFIDSIIRDDKQQTLYWDKELSGYGIRVTPTKTTYIVQGRVNGKTIRTTICLCSQLTPDQARTEAKKLLGDIARGINPNKVKANAKLKGTTLLEAYNDYIDSRQLTKNTLRDYDKAIRIGFPDWQEKTISSISRSMVEERFDKLSEKSKAQANQMFRFLRALFNYAKEKYTSDEGDPLIHSNPCDLLTALKKWHRIDKRTNYIAQDQIKPWFKGITHNELDTEHTKTVKDLCIFIMLLGCRSEEAASILWENVNLKNKTVTFQHTKNHRVHTLPIGIWLTELLSRRHRKANSIYVFPADNKFGYIKNHRKIIKQISESCGVKFSLHDLRRTFASIVNHHISKSLSSYTIKKLLNHSQNDVTFDYIQFAIEDLREPMQMLESFVLKHAGVEIGQKMLN